MVYDINVKRVQKVLKICRKYLTWVQNSVFEGEITPGKLERLKRELESIRKNLEAVNKKKRVYETLKDKLFSLYQEEKAKALVKELDDLAITRKAREPKNED